jgi:glycosyltransferase involved in cell wall biosynthesis
MKIEDEKKPKPTSSLNIPLTVAVLMRNFSRTAGGAESYAVQLTEQLRGQCRISVFSQTFGPAIDGVRYVQVPYLKVLPRWINQAWYALMTWWLTRNQFDVIHSHENVWHGSVHTIHVKTVHSSVLERRINKGLTSTWLKSYTSPRMLTYLSMERSRLKPSRYVIFASDGLKVETDKIFCRKNKTFVLEPGVTIPDYPMSDNKKRQVRESMGLPPSCQVVLFVANDFKKKGLDTLLLAIEHVHRQGNRLLRLLVVGNGIQTAHYKQLIDQLNLREVVRFLGTISDMKPLYEIATCLAHPTTQDVFPMVVLEAMAHQLPVITTAAPWNSMANLLHSGKDALLIPDPFDAEAVGVAIVACLEQNDLSLCLRANGLIFAQRHQWRNITAMQEKIYHLARSNK